MSKFVKVQKVRVNESHKDASKGEFSHYWEDAGTANRRDEYGHIVEHPQANPDVLAEKDAMYSGSQPGQAQFIMGEAIAHLQGQQKAVYLLMLREGRTQEETAAMLGISRSSVRVYYLRAITFIHQYCKAAITRGEV